MPPEDIFHLALLIAEKLDIKATEILLGWDHLGPIPWSYLPAAETSNRAAHLAKAAKEGATEALDHVMITRSGDADETIALQIKKTKNINATKVFQTGYAIYGRPL